MHVSGFGSLPASRGAVLYFLVVGRVVERGADSAVTRVFIVSGGEEVLERHVMDFRVWVGKSVGGGEGLSTCKANSRSIEK
jgi:hypothetical protein